MEIIVRESTVWGKGWCSPFFTVPSARRVEAIRLIIPQNSVSFSINNTISVVRLSLSEISPFRSLGVKKNLFEIYIIIVIYPKI